MELLSLNVVDFLFYMHCSFLFDIVIFKNLVSILMLFAIRAPSFHKMDQIYILEDLFPG